MSGLGVRFVAVVCLFVCLSGKSSAHFWIPATLPPDSNDPYYKAFHEVPPANVTATKLMNNFLNIYLENPVPRFKRRIRNLRDVVLVIDGSGSIGSCEFNKGKKALKYMMRLAKESTTRIDMKYAAVTFSTSATTNFKFLPYSTAANEIMKITYPGGLTNTPAGLEDAKTLFDDPLSGRRSNARKMVFLVTDGQSNDRHQTISKARELKSFGLEIIVVGVGGHIAGIDEMVKVASFPPKDNLYRVESYGEFWKLVKLIIKKVSRREYTIVEGQYDPPCST